MRTPNLTQPLHDFCFCHLTSVVFSYFLEIMMQHRNHKKSQENHEKDTLVAVTRANGFKWCKHSVFDQMAWTSPEGL